MHPIANPPPHTYGVPAIDRAAERRRDEAWLAARRADPATRVVRLAGLKVPVAGDEDRPRLLASEVAELGRAVAEDSVFLGLRGETAWFAEDAGEEAAVPPGDAGHVELRAVGTLLPADEAALLAYARALMHWHGRNGFCPVCGHPTAAVQGGHVRHCAGCGADHFPRTDPAVIVLVTFGDLCLLGRSPRFPPGMYSTLAGFVEPGESLEETLRREVWEEAGVEIVGLPAYRSSQPWPFPQSLMLGFRARAETTELRPDPEELEDARWLARADLRDPGRRPVRLPNADSIARFLIDEWLAEED